MPIDFAEKAETQQYLKDHPRAAVQTHPVERTTWVGRKLDLELAVRLSRKMLEIYGLQKSTIIVRLLRDSAPASPKYKENEALVDAARHQAFVTAKPSNLDYRDIDHYLYAFWCAQGGGVLSPEFDVDGPIKAWAKLDCRIFIGMVLGVSTPVYSCYKADAQAAHLPWDFLNGPTTSPADWQEAMIGMIGTGEGTLQGTRLSSVEVKTSSQVATDAEVHENALHFRAKAKPPLKDWPAIAGVGKKLRKPKA